MAENQDFPILAEAEEQEMTIKEMLAKAREFWLEIKANWRIVAAAAALLSAVMLYFEFQKPITYAATYTFMLSDDSAPSAGGLLALIGGIDVGGPSRSNPDKILLLSKSRSIMEKALFKRATINGTEDFYANHIIRIQEFDKAWEEAGGALKGFLFKNGDPAKFERLENAVLKTLHAALIGNPTNPGIYSGVNDGKTGVITLRLETRSEELSIEFLMTIFDQLGQFYVDKSVQSQRETFQIVSAKKDSIERALYRKDYASARFQDQSAAFLFGENRVPGTQLNRDVNLLTLMYGEAVKNTEAARLSLQSNTPYVQPIDRPIEPIYPARPSFLTALLLGSILGAVLAILFIIGRKLLREAKAAGKI